MITFWGWKCPYCNSDVHPFEYELENSKVPCGDCGKNIKGIFLQCERIEKRIEEMVYKYDEKIQKLRNLNERGTGK